MIVLVGMIAAIGLGMYAGYKKGMIKIVLSFLALAITLVIVTIATPIVCDMVKGTDQFKDIMDKTERYLEKKGVFSEKNDEAIIDSLPVPEQFKKILKDSNTPSKFKELSVNNINEYVVNMTATFILTGSVFAILFIIVYILVRITISVLDVIGKLPFLKQINQLGGIAIGAVEGIFLIWVFFVFVNIFGNTEFAAFIFEQVNENEIATFVYNNNLVMKILLALMP